MLTTRERDGEGGGKSARGEGKEDETEATLKGACSFSIYIYIYITFYSPHPSIVPNCQANRFLSACFKGLWAWHSVQQA